jgi:hypothetical protein
MNTVKKHKESSRVANPPPPSTAGRDVAIIFKCRQDQILPGQRRTAAILPCNPSMFEGVRDQPFAACAKLELLVVSCRREFRRRCQRKGPGRHGATSLILELSVLQQCLPEGSKALASLPSCKEKNSSAQSRYINNL